MPSRTRPFAVDGAFRLQFVSISLIGLVLASSVTAQSPRLLTGEYVGPPPGSSALAGAAAGLAEDGNPNVLSTESLPVLDDALRSRAALLAPSAKIRVIVFLEYLPHAQMRDQVTAAEQAELDSIRGALRAILSREAAAVPRNLSRDADGLSAMQAQVDADRSALRALARRHEAVSRRIAEGTSALLRPAVETSQQPVVAALAALGAEIEFTTVAGNAIVANVPAGALERVSEIPGVARVAEDEISFSQLDVADDASRVSVTGGLWPNGFTGGAYDPAIIDSGADRANPLLVDQTGYANFWTWYVVAAAADPLYNEPVFDEDDYQGHGTHVQGIVASHGSAAYPNHLGMAYGVAKVVNLKAGVCCSSTGGAFMYNSDRMNVVDRALYNASALRDAAGTGNFLDDVDGMNLSYGGSTTSDDTDASRFLDSAIFTYSDLPITVSAGNSGPSNTTFNSPAISYNAITVANVDDQNTTPRNDDTIASSSTRGPTAGNRRKPDIAAPGTNIKAPNNDWETEADIIDKSGTSMAAPMVLGVAMDLMDAGVTDELEIKALLINTAQKNEAGINFESDADGWSTAYGWGYMNAQAAYYHRNDVVKRTVTENGQPGDYVLFSGQMRDEGSGGEGRDRATIVWNRHAVYDPAAAPTTYYALSDLNLRLYNETTGTLIDSDLTGPDNVQQVRIGSGAGFTDVIVKAYAWSSDFAHGGTTESFALATEEGFTEVPFPDSFQGIALWPSSVEPNEQFQIEFWLRNDSEIASHSNSFDLQLPTGFVRNAGSDPFAAGSIAGGGGTSSHVVWTITAGGTTGAVTVVSTHTHSSYLESYGPFNWNMGINVEVDTTPPSPSPMAFSLIPYELNTSQVAMAATVASDLHGPVQYYFDYTSSPSGGAGGSDSGWQTSTGHTDSALTANDEYCYRVRARDAAQTPNYTAYSAISCDYTAIETPVSVQFGGISASSIQARSSTAHSNLGLGSSGLRISNVTLGTNSGWQSSNTYWTSGGLAPNTLYSFRARARNGDAAESPDSSTVGMYTLANAPSAAAPTGITPTSIQANWGVNGNPAGTQFLAENQTTGGTSGWTTATSWTSSGLTPDTGYTFRVKARNALHVETGWVSLGSASTLPLPMPVPSIGGFGLLLLVGALLATSWLWARGRRTRTVA